MALIKWGPRRSLLPLSRELERWFDDPLFDWDWPRSRFFSQELLRDAFVPAVNVYEDDKSLSFEVELPGVEEKDINLEITGNTLRLRAERKHEEEVREENYLRREHRYGMFERAFAVPAGLKTEDVKAKLEKGVLHITLPKAEEAKTKKIPVQADS